MPISRNSRAAIILIVLLAAGFGGRAVYIGVLPNLIPKRFGVVESGKVYRSGQLTPGALKDVVHQHGIRTIIDLGSTIHGTPDAEARNQRSADALGVRRHVMRLYGDSTGNPNYYIQALRLAANPGNQPVLIHCGAGTERTGLACLLYKNLYLGTPLEEGFQEARRYGHDPKRTPQMREMMQRYSAEILSHVRDGGQVEGFPSLPDPVPQSP